MLEQTRAVDGLLEFSLFDTRQEVVTYSSDTAFLVKKLLLTSLSWLNSLRNWRRSSRFDAFVTPHCLLLRQFDALLKGLPGRSSINANAGLFSFHRKTSTPVTIAISVEL